jgi:hypothetical protein
MANATRLFTLQVKRYSYSIINGNSTSQPVKRLWSLQRNCAIKCEPGCIVIGERTKLYACTVCCDTDLCNTMNDGAPPHQHSTLVTVFCILLLTAFTSWHKQIPLPRTCLWSQKCIQLPEALHQHVFKTCEGSAVDQTLEQQAGFNVHFFWTMGAFICLQSPILASAEAH